MVHYEDAGLDHLKKKKPVKGTDNAIKVALINPLQNVL